MKSHLVAIPIALLLMLLAVILGALRLLSLQGIISPAPLPLLQLHHGELTVFGFLAPLILTERYLGATTFSLHPIVRAMPFAIATGAVLKVLFWVTAVNILNILATVAIALAVVLYMYLLYRVGRESAQPLPFHYMNLGALVLLVGAFLSISYSPAGNSAFTLFLISFPIFTILGERVELSRFLSAEVYRWARWGLWIAVVASILLLLRILGVGSEYLVAVWAVLLTLVVAPLFQAELILVKAGQSGLHRYLGRHLILAYIWFFLGLVILVVAKESYPLYDAGTHSLAIGFVLTMIMAHAPVIAPVILRRNVAEERLSYYPVALLTLSVVMRVAGYFLQAGGLRLPVLVGFSGVVAFLALLALAAMLVRSFRPA